MKIALREIENTSARMSRYFDYDHSPKTKSFKIKTIGTDEQFRDQIRVVLGKHRLNLFSGGNNKSFVTFGSCFAVNVAKSLRSKGASVYTMTVTEDVNSPFNNRLLLRRIFLKEKSAFTNELEQTSLPLDYTAVRDLFASASEIIFTLGNIFHLVNSDGNALIATVGTTLVKESVQETEECLDYIFALLREHTKARLYVSVSPIPISGYRGDDFATALEADTFSKSQLITVLRSKKRQDVTYIPTYEIFRGLAPYTEFPMFGKDDGHPRHLSERHIDMVMENLL